MPTSDLKLPAPWTPRAPHLVALGACIAAALLLLWPLLTGQILFGGSRSDMFIAGYSFRLFGAEWFKATGSIPQWNPYIFGGLPYIGAMHGDIFYPTAWLRWIMPVDLAITWGMAVHFVLAGWFTYRFTRALGLGWWGALFAGVAYELTGIVASQMSPGHDGKLFVSALTPLAFWTLLAAVRHGRRWAYGAFALVVALTILGHYHMSYFLLIALGLWTLYLALWDPERPTGRAWQPIALATIAVIVGLGITALQTLPFFAYIPFSPRAAGGPNTGWEFATTYAFPPAELLTLVLPEFNGLLEAYWGTNPIKLHTEFIGFVPLALAALALGDRTHRRLVIAMSAGALLFLLFSFAGHTPFYRPFFELLPLLNKIRAMGMVFYLVAFPVSVLAAIGVQRLLSGEVPKRTLALVTGAGALLGLLGATGGLQGLATSLAVPERLDGAEANRAALQVGGVRMLIVVVIASALLWLLARRSPRTTLLSAALMATMAGELWSVDRQFYIFSPRAQTLFADDAITSALQKTSPPYRVFDFGMSYGWSLLMKYRIPVVRGYHGFELQRYDELAGVNEGYANIGSPNLLELLSVRFLILPSEQAVPGFHKVVGPITTTFGTPAVLYEQDTVPAYARVLLAAAKIPDVQTVPTLVDPRFDARGALLLPDSSSAAATAAAPPFPRSSVRATVREWQPGAMTIALTGADTTDGHLVVSENWYKDWRATVDGRPATVRRGDHSLLAVDLPRGAKEVKLVFDSPEYARGKIVSLVSLLLAFAMIAVGHRRGSPAAPLP